jgi:hypothetical protein
MLLAAVEHEAFGIGWMTLAMLNAGIAQGKNRGGMNWFLLSLLFGPLATFFLVAFFPKEPAVAERLE